MSATVLVAALAIAGSACGSSGNSSKSNSTESHSPAMTITPPTSTPTSPPVARAGGTVAAATVGNLGKVLVDGKGRTVYLFEKDHGTTSSCSGACAAVWPPVITTGKPQAGSGAKASMLGTTSRSGGKTQVTYGGHPLYYYTPDAGMKGSAKGQGLNQFGGGWYVVSPAGKKVEQGGDHGGGGGGGY
ncbi:COG4315 family predicted lipoprotein [Actinomadura oligospora]|uniref:COG4315 family predicted lipoprotein n=1 Tax=Actinomadura oligospora TaxID=111804 RepID=UPI00047DF615|nr:hypothetical protein [Actinomadura oligospora]